MAIIKFVMIYVMISRMVGLTFQIKDIQMILPIIGCFELDKEMSPDFEFRCFVTYWRDIQRNSTCMLIKLLHKK